MKEKVGFKLLDVAKFDLASLQDLTPMQAFHETINKIRESIRRGPTKVKTRVRYTTIPVGTRHLSYREIAQIESDMIAAGIDIVPRFCKKGVNSMKQFTEIEKRLSNFFNVISGFVEGKGRFTLDMMDSEAKAKLTGNEAYFRRTIYDDLKRLVKAGLIYRRGRQPAVYYLGDERVESPGGQKLEDSPEPASESLKARSITPIIPDHITVTMDVNLTLTIKD